MAPRFITKTTLTGLHPLSLDGIRLLDLHRRVQDIVASSNLDAATLFAEPVVTWPTADAPGSISWYTEETGPAEKLADLEPARRELFQARLSDALRRLHPLLDQPESGPLLRRALSLGHESGIMSVGGAPVLTEWGLVLGEAGSAEEMIERGTAWTRRYVAPAPRPSIPAAQGAVLPIRAAAAAAVAPDRAAPSWWLIPAAALVALAFLGLGLFVGIRAVTARVAERPTSVALLDEKATQEETARQREQNAALEKEIAARKALLGGNVCIADPAQMPQLGPNRAASVPPAAVPPPPGGQAFQGSLADLLTQAVVLIIAPERGPDGNTATGTGFFITPDLVLTNRHVIESAEPSQILVTSHKLGRTRPAQIVAQTAGSEIGTPDIALLRVVGASGIQPLALTDTAAPLDQVIAAGFPGLLMQADEAFTRLLHGDASSVPEVILTDGRINAIQASASGMKIMPHSAAVSGGNSGGPLADACGRVVGVNTFITANRQQVAHANYAQKSDAVIEFLKQNGVDVTVLTGPCTPGAPPTVTPSPTTPSPPPAPRSAPTAPPPPG